MENSGILESIDQASLSDAFFNLPLDNIDIGRESIPIFEYDTSFGRESLGILKFDFEISNADPSQRSSSYFSAISPNVFDQAFLISPLTQSECDISPSSLNSTNFSFRMKGFDQPSSIKLQDSLCSIQTRTTDAESINKLNEAFLYTSELRNLCSTRSRFRSLPVYSTKKSDLENELLVQQMLNRISEGCYNKNDENLKSTLDINSDNFNDSVFIEARHLSSRFSEGSNDGYMLDETDPPELFDEEIEEKEVNKKYDSEQVFKKIDQLFPANGFKKLDEKLNNRTSESTKQNVELKDESENASGMEQKNGLDIMENNVNSREIEEKDGSEREKRVSYRNSKDILGSLSDMLSKDILSESETEQGQTLLNTLAVMLDNKSRERSKSFSNGSIGNLPGSSKSQHESTKRTVTKPVMLKRHSNSFSHPTKTLRKKLVSSSSVKSSFEKPKDNNVSSTRSAGSSVSGTNNDGNMSRRPNSLSSASEASVDSKSVSLNSGGVTMVNLKLKRGAGNVRRGGPLKATVPVESFTKPQPKATTPKTQQKLPKLQSRISTPIREVQLKPMAQSTPDNNNKLANSSSEQQNNQKSFCSPTVKDKSINNYSSLANSLSSYKESSLSKDNSSAYRSQLPRRNSLSEGRPSTPLTSKKNNSLKESGLMRAFTKLKQNLSNSMNNNNQSKSALKDRSNVSGNVSNTSEKNVNTSRKMIMSFGKENTSVV